METNKRAVNLATLIICLGSQNFKDSLPGTALTPALVTSVNHSKVTKVFGQASMDLPLKECSVAQTIKSLFTGRL